MIKEEIRSYFINLLPKYESIERFHPQVVDRAIERALAEFYNLVFLRSPLELQRYSKEFGYTTALTVSIEAGTGIYYTNYPTGVSIIPFPDKASGVRRISTIAQGGITFYPVDPREMDLLAGGSYADTVTSKIGYCARRTRIEYYNPSAVVIATGVRADLIIPFSDYLDTDDVMIPDLTGNEGSGFTDRVLQILSAVRPVELFENKTIETKE